jgi:hypothetical protein
LTYLSVDAHVLKKSSNPSQTLVKVSPFLKRLRYGLQDFLVLLGVVMVRLFYCPDVFFEI